MLFDIDGTLLRNAGAHHRLALAAGIRAVTGLETTLEGISTSGMLDRDLIRGMMRAAGASARLIERTMGEIVAAAVAHYGTNCTEELRGRVCAGAAEFLARLRGGGAVLGLVTGNLSAIGWRKMELAGLREFFSVGAFAEDGRTRARLARVALWRAIREGLVSKQCRVSLVGDHANDIAAAKANQFLAVAVATGLMPLSDLQEQQPDILVRDLTELDPALLLG